MYIWCCFIVNHFHTTRLWSIEASLTWNTSLCTTHTFNSCMYILMEVRQLESLYGGVFSLQTVISELLLWVVTLEGYISYQCVGGAQGRGWIEEKREQWMIEFAQSSGSQCNCVGLHLCLPWYRKSHLRSDFNCPHAPLKPRLSLVLKEMGKNRWGKENWMVSVLGKRSQGIKEIFINKEL